jgi:hypothetical protein
MATVVLQYAGAALGTFLGGPLGGMIGRAVGGIAGNMLDQSLFGAKPRNGPRLNDLRVMASEEGAAIPALWGRMRISGQVIWATNLLEEKQKVKGGKGGLAPRASEFSYFANFAVGLCEGEIDGIGRVWIDGKETDVSGFTWRLHTGSDSQLPDSLITAVEGEGAAPAYRGLAYLVFEHLPLADFGNRIPQLSVEVFRKANPLADQLRAITIIPGATEFGYDTNIVTRNAGKGVTESENAHAAGLRSDWSVSLDQLQDSARNVAMASLVVAWFGTDLRCGHCQIKPGVESASKVTKGGTWSVSGIGRNLAHVVSTHDGAPAYGGTPSDASVRHAIADLKARGLKVMFNPFILMDVPAGNSLPDPYGGTAQAAYPWRGRITASLAPGRAGSPDKTAAAESEVADFLGTAAPGQFSAAGEGVAFLGIPQWTYRRMILHYAKLCALAGGVDAFLIGSELRGLTTLRSGTSDYPFVAGLMTLAAEVKAILPAAQVSYAADWSEYFGHQPADGSADLHFHLDPLWSSSSVGFVGIDNYLPLTDWRDGADHLDALAGARDISDRGYLDSGIAGGEYFDWYYANDADREAQSRSAISDGAYGKPWVFRPKDLKSWWEQPHINRPGGVEAASPTGWVPQSKPIWFTELGCPAIDKATNAPNFFVDAKSSESAWPPFSNSQPDPLIQQRCLEAHAQHWQAGSAGNPLSASYSGPMVDPGRIFIWAWDARPFPVFPRRTDVWADGSNHARGHWLNGRLTAVDVATLISAVCARFGLTHIDVDACAAQLDGFLLDRPMSGREALEGLLQAFALDAVESEGKVIFRPRRVLQAEVLAADDLIDPGADKPVLTEVRKQETNLPRLVRLSYVDSDLDYRAASSGRSRNLCRCAVLARISCCSTALWCSPLLKAMTAPAK